VPIIEKAQVSCRIEIAFFFIKNPIVNGLYATKIKDFSRQTESHKNSGLIFQWPININIFELLVNSLENSFITDIMV